MHSIVWKICEMPHAHILDCLIEKDLSHQNEHIISAEIPDTSESRSLYEIVYTHIGHGPWAMWCNE